MTEHAVPRHHRPSRLRTFLFGAPYYPEHWTDDERADDPARMAAAGVNCVRMAEFAWDRMEPREGAYDFSFFDAEVDRLGAAGVRTILCTPTATPPRWLTFKYPEVLRVDRDGRRMEHGSRQHACTNSPLFRHYSRRITAAMAEHFAGRPHVIGWQTDNELNCHFALCYCQACQEAFRQWCRQRYGDDIDALNDAWGAAFWALTFGDFAEVLLPTDRPARSNPSHVLDHRRFVSDTTAAFHREQAEILRAANADWFITHNGLMRHIDYAAFARDLDVLGVDLYPAFSMDDHAIPFSADLARSAAGNFIVPELQAGPGGQVGYMHPTPAPGQMRLWMWQSAAHGADGVLHFRWRTCRFGAEEYWCGVLDHDNVPRRRYEEFAREGAELARAGPRVLGTAVDVEVGVLVEHEQLEAHAAMPLGNPSPRDQARAAHRELWRRAMPVGLVEASDGFDGLKLLVLPGFVMMDADLAERLEAFVRAGGTLLATAWTGTRDRCNRIIDHTPPGLLAGLFGAAVDEYGKLPPGGGRIELAGGAGVESGGWYEVLKPASAEVIGTWADGHYAGGPAVTAAAVGKGRAFYVGTFLTDANAAPLVAPAISGAGAAPLVDGLPEGVEAVRRSGDGRSLLFLLNHADAARDLTGLPPGADLLAGRDVDGALTLGPRDVAVIESS